MAGTWQALASQPNFAASTMLLLTDGTVMVQSSNSKNWARLHPDAFGNYVNGTWATMSPMSTARLYYASAVLKDGRVFVAGGEYNGGITIADLDTAEIYDPVLDTWTSIAAPPGWTAIGDAPCCVLPDGRLLLGSINDVKTAIYDPLANTWTAGPNKDDSSSEETWTLLPDETVLTAECNKHPKSEKYVAAAPPSGTWVSAGTIPTDLVQSSSIEIGPALLLPDGRVFGIGATGHTAVYTPPPIASAPGTWAAGPDFPKDASGNLMEAKDAPGCLLPNGRVLCVAGPASTSAYPGPTSFFEFDGSSLNAVSAPGNAGGPPFNGRMLLLPTGQVLFSANSIWVYTPDGSPDEDWKPEITGYPTYVRVKQTYPVHGRLFNGLSQAVSYGDDASMATNYPIVKLRSLSSGQVWYCRTFDHSTMGVATGLSIQSTSFKVPGNAALGQAELRVIANGIESDPVSVTVGPFLLRFIVDDAFVSRLVGSFADGPLYALTRHGPVPVDGDGPIKERARAAYSKIFKGIEELTAIGGDLERQRVKEQEAKAEPAHSSQSERHKVKEKVGT